MFSFLYILKSFCLFWFILQIYGKFSNLQIYFFSSVYEVWTHLTILMRDGSFPLSHAICRSTRIRTGVNFSSPLCKSGMFYHYTMDLLRKENLRRVYFEQILKISEVTLSNYYSFCRRDWNRTSIFTYQLPVAILSGLRVTRRYLLPGRITISRPND